MNTNSKTRRSKMAVHFYLEDGFLVRGTLDPVVALGWAVGDDDNFELKYYTADCGRRDDSGTDPTPEEVAALADLCHELIQNARAGLFRIRPATEAEQDDNYGWFTVYAEGPGRGTFEGVEFR